MANFEKVAENVKYFPKFEDIKKITQKYKAEIDQVRSTLLNCKEQPSDVTIYRFMKGWKFDLTKTSEKLHEMLKYREENKLSDIRDKLRKSGNNRETIPHSEKMRKCLPVNGFHGCDKSGQPIVIALAGGLDLEALLRLMTLDEMREYFMYDLEARELEFEAQNEKTGKLTRCCRIIDLDGLGRKHLNAEGLRCLKNVLVMGTANYPESLGNCYIINAPWVFNMVWKAIKPLLKESTQAKIQILGGDYKEILRENIEDQHLPVCLGGTCQCTGGCIPRVDEEAGMTEVTVGARSAFSIEKNLNTGDLVFWSYRTRVRDIGFRAEFFPGATADTSKGSNSLTGKGELIAEDKYNPKDGFAASEYRCKVDGAFKLTWDNHHSYMTSKTLVYKVGVASRSALMRGVSQCDDQALGNGPNQATITGGSEPPIREADETKES